HGNEITSFTYDYDCFGRRVRKYNVLTGESRLFFWQDDRLISECDEKLACPGGHPSAFGSEPHTDAHSVRTYIYEPNGNSFRPLAMLRGRGKNTKVFYYINDHLGTPQELVSPSGEIVWSAVYHAYGQQAFTLANHIPQPLRFQGQYHDDESGLSYNRYRYYDVSALRYLSPDPIGLAGGVNAYAYVPSPLSWVDPLGLSGCDLTGSNWKFNPDKDVDLRNSNSTYQDALNEAFKRTGVPREQFEVVKWGKDQYGKSIPVEWQGPEGASVNIDIPSWNNVKSNGDLGEGPHAPHIGYQTPRKPRIRGHIFINLISATRR
ncbi:hypothetical protein EYY95_14720, partial [Hafnia alvei]|uniref:RHS repeat-associated core domain-containing protein n=1 Tax=Hafnia alvei TaxID=569 RepID=UPI0010E17979